MTATLPRVLYAFRDGWEQRKHEVATGAAPAESYGYFALGAAGADVTAVDSTIVDSKAWKVASRVVQRAYYIPRTGLGYRVDQARFIARELADDPNRVVLATTDSIGLPLLALRARGTLSNPVALLSIGLADSLDRKDVSQRLAQRLLGLLEEALQVFTFTPAERDYFARVAPRARVSVLPLGIDVDWWRAGRSSDELIDVLSPGRDAARSFPTLAEAVRGSGLKTVAVGALARAQGLLPEPGLELRPDVSFAELRRLFATSRTVAIPARAARYGAGQATALQAMAAGRAVVMTDSGWAQHAGLIPGRHFIDVPPTDPTSLRAAVLELAADDQLRDRLGAEAELGVREHFSMDKQLATLRAGLSPE